jgi:quinol monooxygenase YgiN
VEDSKPVTAIISFRLLPGFRETWLGVWTELRDAALTEPTCRDFRLLYDRHDEAHCAVLTEWDRASDLDVFVREAGVTWLNRCLECTREPPAYSIFETIPLETVIATQCQNWELVPVD